ncbi:putative non-specific serine/threonine protein kinase [Helianthus debilis subsp. tardiflorus]
MLSPEYLSRSWLSKADVYSFGLFVLETVTGRRAYDYLAFNQDPLLLDYVRMLDFLWYKYACIIFIIF